jgi:mono/diheme cytochrome c family protein
LGQLPKLFMFALLVLGLAACGGAPDPKYSELPPGDAGRGQALFTQAIDGAPSCVGCHSLGSEQLTGPSLKGFGAVAGQRVSGLSAGDYAIQSILHPAAYLVSGYSNVMYNQYRDRLSQQQLSDLVAWLLTQ